jgi:four helix bundle protein
VKEGRHGQYRSRRAEPRAYQPEHDPDLDVLPVSEPRRVPLRPRACRSRPPRSHRDPELRDQATRAAKSAFLNLCEGLPDDRIAMRRKYFLASDGSLHEVVGAVDLACAIGAVGAEVAAEIQALAVRLRAMLRGLLRSARGA